MLAALLRAPALTDTAVIVNEFGEVGLDHRLVARGEEDSVVLLENGCLCCSAGDSLGETLTDLFHRRARGEIPHFSRVIIETSGMADPTAILATLLADRFMAGKYRISAVITTIDAEHGRQTVRRYAEAAAQLALADRLVITKCDRIYPAAAADLRCWLRTENPRADILMSSHGEGEVPDLLAPAPPMADAAVMAEHRHHAHHSIGVATIFLPIPDPVSWERYAALVSALQSYGRGLLRTKGLIRIDGEAGLLAIQGVRRLFAPPVPLPDNISARTGLVLIGEELDREGLQAALALALGH